MLAPLSRKAFSLSVPLFYYTPESPNPRFRGLIALSASYCACLNLHINYEVTMQVFEFTKILTFISLLVTAFPLVQAKVDPPNYNFSLDELAPLKPGADANQTLQQYPRQELVLTNGPYRTYRIYVKQLRYLFPVLVQTFEDKITDIHATLPSYFLHDIFHQSLINRIGKQDQYFKKEEQALYVWNDVDGLKYIYSGACTITCFPLFYSVSLVSKPTPSFKSILERLKDSEF